MQVIFIRHYKLKAVIACTLIFLGVFTLLFSRFIINNNLTFKITIDNYLSFSYPISFKLKNILVNKRFNESSAKVSLSLKAPVTRSFINFEGTEGMSAFDYPSRFDIEQELLSANCLLYHIDFRKPSKNASGFIQVWDLPYSLPEFLTKNETQYGKSYKDCSSMPVEINGIRGYSWDYIILWKDNKYYKGKEVFLKKDSNMYRISYFTPESMWSKSQGDLFWAMVKSVSTY